MTSRFAAGPDTGTRAPEGEPLGLHRARAAAGQRPRASTPGAGVQTDALDEGLEARLIPKPVEEQKLRDPGSALSQSPTTT